MEIKQPLNAKEIVMLVLTRKAQERIQIGQNITITVVRVKGRSVRLGIEAPDNVRIVRSELAAAMAEFRDEPSGEAADVAEFTSATESSEALLSADEEDETRSVTSPTEHALPGGPQRPLGRIPSGRYTSPLRRPSRLGPGSLRTMSCR